MIVDMRLRNKAAQNLILVIADITPGPERGAFAMTNHHANDCDVSVDFDELLADPAVAAATEDAEHRSLLRAILVAQRKATHLTQKDVARLMQTTQSSVSELENGAVDPHLSTLQRYARAVGARVVVRVSMPQLSADNDADVWACR